MHEAFRYARREEEALACLHVQQQSAPLALTRRLRLLRLSLALRADKLQGLELLSLERQLLLRVRQGRPRVCERLLP